MKDKTTYIAREDFLNPIPKVETENGIFEFEDGTYTGQLGLDYNDYNERVLYCWDGDMWLDMTAVVANFTYCNENDIKYVFEQLVSVPKPDNIEPLTWSSYKATTCRDLECKNYENNCGIDHIDG